MNDEKRSNPAARAGRRREAGSLAEKEDAEVATFTGSVHCRRLDEWPSIDQSIWRHSCSPGDPFDDTRYGTTLRGGSLSKIAKGYGRWLCFLDSKGWLDHAAAPLERVTRSRLRHYLRELKAAGNADYTIIGRFSELALAMKIFAPTEDTSWVRKPCGNTVYAMLPKQKRWLLVPDCDVMLDWAHDVIENADSKPTRVERLCAFRDGVLLAILASCARRLRSIALLRAGHEIKRIGDIYRVELEPEQVKTKKRDHFDLPISLTPHIDRYMLEIRPKLLAGRVNASFWISGRAGAWSARAIQNQVLALSRERFGKAFGPHRFRHSIATSAPRLDPTNPAIGALVLGISKQVCQDSYNRGGQANAALVYDECLAKRRATLQARIEVSKRCTRT